MSVLYAAEISRRLRELIDASALNASQAAEGLQVARSTLYDILNGTNFPDIHTLANAEEFLGASLWPAGPQPGRG